MTELQINTTQNVNINFTAASVGERILAYGIDLLIKIAYVIVIYQLVFNLIGLDKVLDGMDFFSEVAIVIVFFLPYIFYTFVFEALLDGQTPGKRVLKIKVVKIDGYQASISDFAIRWFFRIVDINMMTGIVALISIIVSKKNQRLGDMTAGTAVISLRNSVGIDHTILMDLDSTYQPTYPNVIRLSDNDARIIKETFTTAKASRDFQTMIKLRKKILEVIETKMEHSNDIDFIDTILKDYNFYTQSM